MTLEELWETAPVTLAWARGSASAYVVPERGVGDTKTLAYELGAGEIPKYVKFADGSSRTLVQAAVK